jgi:hypothetical protein
MKKATILLMLIGGFGVQAQIPFLRDTLPVTYFNSIITNSFPESQPTIPESIGAHQLWPGGTTGLDVTGDGLTAGLWEALESGSRYRVDGTNAHLQGTSGSRVTNLDGAGSNSTHATEVAKNLAGDAGAGTDNYGIAYEAELRVYDNNGRFDELNNEAISNGLLVSNHSYTGTAGWAIGLSPNWYGVLEISATEDHKFGRYGTQGEQLYDVSYDSTGLQNPYLTVVKGAGNENGIPTSLPGTWTLWQYNGGLWAPLVNGTPPQPLRDGEVDGGYDCIISGAMGKNVVTVGSCSALATAYSSPSDIVISPRSSCGPADDGRIKPDLVAPGREEKTSYSTPIVSGTVLLLQEAYHNLNSSYMKSATVRGLLCHSAFEAGTNEGPDYKHGWGMVNAEAAGLLIKNNEGNILESSLTNGTTDRYYYYKTSAGEARITLSWTDPEGIAHQLNYDPNDLDNAKVMLINDLDVRLTQMCSQTEYLPYVLDPSNPSAAATKADNTVDNLEQVYQSSIDGGWYEIKVSHKGVLASPQEYSLIIEGMEQPNIWESSTWSKGAPTSSSNVVFYENYPIATSTTLEVNHAFIGNSASIQSTDGTSILQVNGDLGGDDGIFEGDGKVELIGANANICGPLQISNLEVNKTSNSIDASLSSDTVSVTELLTLTSGSLVSGGKVTLAANDNANQQGYSQLDDYSGSGSLSGTLNVQTYVIGNSGWRHLASPVNTTLNDFLKDYDFYYLTGDASAFAWNNSTSVWELTSGTNHPVLANTPLNLWFGTSGSRLYTNLPHLVELSGTINTGTINNSLSYVTPPNPGDYPGDPNGWNMMANPYPTGLDWNSIKADFGAGMNGSYYIFDAATQQYLSHNGATGSSPNVNGVIPPHQSFFVKLDNATPVGSGVLDLNNGDRTLTKARRLKKEEEVIFIKVKGQSKSDVLSLWITPEATEGYDPLLEAHKVNSVDSKQLSLFSSFNENTSDLALSIQALPNLNDDRQVPVHFKTQTTGRFELTIDSLHLEDEKSIWLLDLKTDKKVDLIKTGHSFDHLSNTSNNRFVLFLGEDLKEEDISIHSSLKAFVKDNALQISGMDEELSGTIRIFNMNGQELLTYKTSMSTVSVPLDEIGISGNAVIISYENTQRTERLKVVLP